RLFLIGYRGAGKTVVAPLVAAQLGWDWCDADQVLERRLGKTIGRIFQDHGEPEFRRLEIQVLDEVSGLERHVIATGGGVIHSAENRARLRQGRVVWLTADPVTLWNRMSRDTTQRPDLAQGGLAEVEETLRVRSPIYAACADFTIDTIAMTP